MNGGAESEERIEIESHDFWFKVVDMLQQNWALVQPGSDAGATIYFISDTGGVFDEMRFDSIDSAEMALELNGFRRYGDDSEAKSFMRCPEPPFNRRPHPNGPIYSSGRFWKSG